MSITLATLIRRPCRHATSARRHLPLSGIAMEQAANRTLQQRVDAAVKATAHTFVMGAFT